MRDLETARGDARPTGDARSSGDVRLAWDVGGVWRAKNAQFCYYNCYASDIAF
jgi:hypothetical protein